MNKFLFVNIIVLVFLSSGCISAEPDAAMPRVSKSSNVSLSHEPIATSQNKSQIYTSVPEEHLEIARRLTIVTVKVDGELKYGDGFKDSSEIVPYLQKKHSRLYAQFDKTILKFKIDDGHVIGLVCDRNDGYAISEDSPCTTEADTTYSGTKAQCTFTLQSKKLCLSH
jgi:hypothetical protein